MKIGKDRASGSGDMLADRQTDTQTHTQTCSLQYFATTPAGEVTLKSVFLLSHIDLSLHSTKRVTSLFIAQARQRNCLAEPNAPPHITVISF